tara:strand:+ start:1919 stop:2134 length:216 start_codon:yes stop_codon:yes gene_type:complete
MTGFHKIEVQEVVTKTRVVKLSVDEYPSAQKAEKYIAEALGNVYTNQIGELKDESTEILINGFNLDDFEAI